MKFRASSIKRTCIRCVGMALVGFAVCKVSDLFRIWETGVRFWGWGCLAAFGERVFIDNVKTFQATSLHRPWVSRVGLGTPYGVEGMGAGGVQLFVLERLAA